MEQFNPLFIERRTAPRSVSSLRAYLLTPAGGLLPGLARNFSRSGVFLQTKIPADSSVGDPATIVFAIENGNIVRLLRYAVVIRRESHQGYGLEFERCLWSTGIFRRS
jgi:hypothetical protein